LIAVLQDNSGLFRFITVLFHLFVIEKPLMYFGVRHGAPLTKLKRYELLVRKSSISLFDTSTNKQLLQNFKSKKFNDSLVLAFLKFSCYIQNLVIRQKEPVSQLCVQQFSDIGN